MEEKKPKICKNCNTPFEKRGKVFCSTSCQVNYTLEKNKLKREQLQDKIRRNLWQAKPIGQYQKFIEVFGNEQVCDLCSMTNNDSLNKYNIPLISKLKPGIDDWKVMDTSNWKSYCLRCWTNILVEKRKSES